MKGRRPHLVVLSLRVFQVIDHAKGFPVVPVGSEPDQREAVHPVQRIAFPLQQHVAHGHAQVQRGHNRLDRLDSAGVLPLVCLDALDVLGVSQSRPLHAVADPHRGDNDTLVHPVPARTHDDARKHADIAAHRRIRTVAVIAGVLIEHLRNVVQRVAAVLLQRFEPVVRPVVAPLFHDLVYLVGVVGLQLVPGDEFLHEDKVAPVRVVVRVAGVGVHEDRVDGLHHQIAVDRVIVEGAVHGHPAGAGYQPVAESIAHRVVPVAGVHSVLNQRAAEIGNVFRPAPQRVQPQLLSRL